MLDCGLSDAHHDAGGKSEIAPFIFSEDAQGLGDGFIEALGTDLDGVLDALLDRGRRPCRCGRP